MKFRASLTDRAVRDLEREWIPALEKQGKRISLLLSEEQVYLIQGPLEASGMQVVARWATSAIFASHRVVSRHRNLIAFQADASQLRRGLRGAAALSPDGVDLKLTLRPSAGSGAGAAAGSVGGAGKPYLSIRARSGPAPGAPNSSNAVLLAAVEIPISQPLYPSDVDALIAERDAPLMAPFYVDLASSSPSSSSASGDGGVPLPSSSSSACSLLGVLADRVVALAPSLTLTIDAAGRLEVAAHGVGCGLSSRLRGLEVLPPTARRSADEVDEGARGGTGGDVSLKARVHVASKDLSRALSAVAATNPVRALLGIPVLAPTAAAPRQPSDDGGETAAAPAASAVVGGHLHIVLAFRDSGGGGGGGVDSAVDLSLRVPAVVDEEE